MNQRELDMAQLEAEELRLLEEVAIDEAREDLRMFLRLGWRIVEPETELRWGRHIDAICIHLMALFRGEIPSNRLVINQPPGTMKSLITSVFWPAWMWLHRPGYRIVCGAHQHTLATRDAEKCRRLITSEWYVNSFNINWQLSEAQNRKDDYANTMGGTRTCVSVTGGTTGFRGDCVIIDDALTVMKAKSKAERDIAINWVSKTLPSRLNDQTSGIMAMTMQRLHEEDPAAWAAAQGWELLCLPMEFTPDVARTTCIGWRDWRKKAGDLLFPEMFPQDTVERLKVQLGPIEYAGQYQQCPVPAEGNLIKRDWLNKVYDVLPEKFDQMAQSWDLTFGTQNDDASYVVGQVWGRKGADFFLVDQVRLRADTNQIIALIVTMTRKHPRATAKYVEDKALGRPVIQMLKAHVPGLIAVPPEGGKAERLAATVPLFAAGNVWIPNAKNAPWINDWIEEMVVFPNGKHDDQADATAQLLNQWSVSSKTGWLDIWSKNMAGVSQKFLRR